MIEYINTTVQDPDERQFMLWLYEEFKGLLFSTARKFTSTPEVAEDIVQESILRILPRVSLLQAKERRVIASYIATTVKNVAINQIKSQNSERAFVIELPDELHDKEDLSIIPMDELMILLEQRDCLNNIWSSLNYETQFLLEGKYILGYSDIELAQHIGCKPSSIRMKLTRARRLALSRLIQLEENEHHDKT